MKNRDFGVIKTESEFLSNYSLHDRAQHIGEKYLKDKGIIYSTFGEDRRFEKVWEAGEDKPDIIIMHPKIAQKPLCLLDWKGKKSQGIRLNKRAYLSYRKIAKKMGIPAIVATAYFNDTNLTKFIYVDLTDDSIFVGWQTEWDKNVTAILKPESAKDFYNFKGYIDSLCKR
jgi:hypothetical protein